MIKSFQALIYLGKHCVSETRKLCMIPNISLALKEDKNYDETLRKLADLQPLTNVA